MRYQDRIAPPVWVFIDETWTTNNMAPLRGRTPRGAGLTAQALHGQWNTATWVHCVMTVSTLRYAPCCDGIHQNVF